KEWLPNYKSDIILLAYILYRDKETSRQTEKHPDSLLACQPSSPFSRKILPKVCVRSAYFYYLCYLFAL
ncbi:MAG: hypothetical protein II088_06350, partial [Bacteroidales bacterium]|nr:hypothetical protein [Bacteroidales bacterium]